MSRDQDIQAHVTDRLGDPGRATHASKVFANSTVFYVVNELRWFFSHRMPLAEAVRDAGARVGVVAPSSPLQGQLAEMGFEYHHVDVRRNLHSYSAEIAVPFMLAAVYRRFRPDLVHHVTTKPVLYGSHAARVTNVPAVVNTVAGLGYLFTNQGIRVRALRAMARAAYRFALAHRNSVTIFQNTDDRDEFVSSGLIAPSRAVLVRGSGVDMARFRAEPEPDDVPVVVLVSRMLWDKGVGDFADAARLLRSWAVPCRCVLVGRPDPGNPTSISEATLRAWEAENIIEWWGESADVPSVMARSNLVVLPSYREGLPKVLLEAAASARAIVTNDVPGCREVVEHGRNGLLVPPRNPTRLAEAIKHLVDDPRLRRKMGERGRAIVAESFTQDIIIRQTMSIYSQLLGGGHRV